MENTTNKYNQDVNQNICANDMSHQERKYPLRKRKSKKKSMKKPIEFPVNNRKNGKRVGGWFLIQKQIYLSFLKKNYKNGEGLQSKIFKKLVQIIGSRSLKEVKKFHNQLLLRFGSLQGIVNNYDAKMKLDKCKPSHTQDKTNQKQNQTKSFDLLKAFSSESEKQNPSSIKNQVKKQIIMCKLQNKSKYQLSKIQTSDQQQNVKQEKKQTNQDKMIQEQVLAPQKNDNIYPFSNMEHFLLCAPQLWFLPNPRNLTLNKHEYLWLRQ